jgi:hypothetical protein
MLRAYSLNAARSIKIASPPEGQINSVLPEKHGVGLERAEALAIGL